VPAPLAGLADADIADDRGLVAGGVLKADPATIEAG
jgi:hypothetical protein